MNKIKNKRLLAVLFLVLFSLPIPTFCFSESDELRDYSKEWLKTLRKGNAKERSFALLRSPNFLDCCDSAKNPEVFNLVLGALEDNDPSVREAAAASLGQRVDKDSMSCCRQIDIVPSLLRALGDSDSHVRGEAAKALAFYKDQRAVDGLLERLKDSDPWVKLSAVFALGQIGAAKALDPMLILLEDDSDWRNKYVQQEVLIAVRKIGDPSRKAIPVIMEKFNDEYLRQEIVITLGEFKAVEARDLLLRASNDPNETTRKLAIEAISQLPRGSASKEGEFARLSERGGTSDVEVFIRLLKDPSAEVRARAAEALGRPGNSQAVEPLMDASRDGSEMVRWRAIVALSHYADERILDAVINFIRDDSNANLRDSAQKTFALVAKRTCKESVYISRRETPENVGPSQTGAQVIARVSTVPRELMIYPAAVTKLIEALDCPDSNVRMRFLRALALFADARIEGVLLRYLDDPSPEVRQEALSVLNRSGSPEAVPVLIQALQDRDPIVRAAAARELRHFKDKRAFEPLMERLNDQDDRVRADAIASLQEFDDEKVLELSIEHLKDKSISIRRGCVLYMKRKPDKRAVEPLISLLNDQDAFIAPWSAEALGAIGDKKATEPLIRALKGELNRNRMFGGDMDLRVNAARALGLIKDESAVPTLISCLSDENPRMREQAISALREIGSPAALEAIKNFPGKNKPLPQHVTPGSPVIGEIPRPAIPKGTWRGQGPLEKEKKSETLTSP